MTLMPPDFLLRDASLQSLLAPVPGPDPCGASIRADSLFTDIRLAREEDDPSLPMRQWERPLKKADWDHIETLCTDALIHRSKDLQLVAWLIEAWTRQSAGVAGLARGLWVLRELVERYWEGLHPRLEPADEHGEGCEARVAPLDWLGQSLAHTLRVHVILLPLAQRKPASISLADWERLVASELSAGSDESRSTRQDANEPALTRDEIVANVARHAPDIVDTRLAQVREAMAHLVALCEAFDTHLSDQAPNLRKLTATLETCERVLLQVRTLLPSRASEHDTAQHAQPIEPDTSFLADADVRDPPDDTYTPPATRSPAPALVAVSAWRNRDEAYRTLEALSQYLQSIEPHSPTPYLIRRAVNWGRLPLPELMAEIMQEEGDLNRMVQLLGLNK